MAETVLITGGAGMLGSAVVRDVLAHGDDVVVADVRPSEFFLRGRGVDPGSVAVEALDIVDRDGVGAVLDRHHVTSVIHLAAAVSSVANPDPVAGAYVNCVGTATILEECRRRDIARVVMASTIAVYGADPDRPAEEGSVSASYEEGPTRFAPDAPTYGAGKAFLEALGEQYARRHGMEIAGMRCAFIASAGRPTRYPLGVVSGEFIDAPALGLPVNVADGASVLPYVWVDDVSRQFTTLLHADAALLERGRFFNTGATTCTVAELAMIAREIIDDADIEVGDGAAELVLGNPKHYSDRLFVDTFGVERTTDLRATVATQIDAAHAWPGLLDAIRAGRGA